MLYKTIKMEDLQSYIAQHNSWLTIKVWCDTYRVFVNELETLSKDQADYIGVSMNGPFKNDSYRY